MSIRVNWMSYEPWRRLWEGWVRARGESRIIMQKIQFTDLYNHFVRQIKKTGVDPHTVDVESFISPTLTYGENKKILDQILRVPLTEKDYEAMSEDFVNESMKEVARLYPEVAAEWRKRLEEAEKESEKYPKVDRERRKFKNLSKDLAEELEETKRRLEEERRKPPEIAAFKIRILKPFTEGIMRYTVGSVIETRNVDWALDKIERGLAERVGVEVPVKRVLPPPVEKPPPPKEVKVLPPPPEVCPIDGTPLEVVVKVPIIVRDSPLTAEEEYLRARAGLPLPTAEVKWIDIPPTMKVWMCKNSVPHFFERDPRTGKLVQKASEFLFRKIVRETAKLRKIVAPPTVIPREIRPYLPPMVPRKVKALHYGPRAWLEINKGIKWYDFLRMPDDKRKALLDEYTRLAREGK